MISNLFRTMGPGKDRSKRAAKRALVLEYLEDRRLMAVDVEFRPVGTFFQQNPAAMGLLTEAARQVTSRIQNNLAAIPSGYRWTAYYTNPSNGVRTRFADTPIPANRLVVHVGGRSLSGAVAEACPQFSGGPQCGVTFDPQGVATHRGQQPRRSTWGGSISFSTTEAWHFGRPGTPVPSGRRDFYSAALHEMGHLLGFTNNNSDSITSGYSSGSFWTGPEVVLVNRNNPVKLDTNRSFGLHWDPFVRSNGRQAVMTRDLVLGSNTKRMFTTVDFAALKDIGWNVSTAPPAAATQKAFFSGTTTADFTVWRPSSGSWYVAMPDETTVVRQWGLPGDTPVNADYDGDGRSDTAVWRPGNGTWYVQTSSGTPPTITRQWGLPGDIPQPADFNGWGSDDFAVWRPQNGTWYVSRAENGLTFSRQFGLPGDFAVANTTAFISSRLVQSGSLLLYPGAGPSPFPQTENTDREIARETIFASEVPLADVDRLSAQIVRQLLRYDDDRRRSEVVGDPGPAINAARERAYSKPVLSKLQVDNSAIEDVALLEMFDMDSASILT